MIGKTPRDKCYACGKPLGKTPAIADTLEDQYVFVGRECIKRINAAGALGYATKRSGLKLYPLTAERRAYFESRGWFLTCATRG